MTSYFEPYDDSYFGGSAGTLTLSATSPFDVVINGRGYLLQMDEPNIPAYGLASIPILRAMFLQDRGTTEIGEHSLNPDDYWRRSTDDWSNGGGQKYLDLATSQNNRFHTSKGIDPWTQGQLALLPDTARKFHETSTNNKAVVAGGYLYYLGATSVSYAQDLTVGSPTITAVTQTGGDTALSAAVDMTTDGFTVWVADSARVHYTTRGSANFHKFHTADEVVDLIRSAKGRLFTATGNVISTNTLTAGSAVQTGYFTHPNSDWVWTDVAGGPDSVFFSGFSGTESAIYSATLKSDASDLDAPVVVASLPSGEIVRAMHAYLGVLVIGTDKGWRIASIGNTAGSLILGSLVTMDQPPRCFESQDRFVWYGWTNYDSTSTGIGRMDLSVFNTDVPAYASDLMGTVQGAVTSIVTFQGLTMFTVSGSGIWVEQPTKVPSATYASGWLNYALAEPKVAIKLNVQYRAGAGSFQVELAADDNAAVPVGITTVTSAVAGNSVMLAVPQLIARAYEMTFTLTRSAGDTTQGPVIDRTTLMVEPQPERRFQWTIPLQLHPQELSRLGAQKVYDPKRERDNFKALVESQQIVPFQDSEQTTNVTINDLTWIPYNKVGDRRQWAGTLVVIAKEIG